MRAALKLEKKCHAENWIQNSIWNPNIQKINKQKKYPQNKTGRYLCPIVRVGLPCVYLFVVFTPILPPPHECAN